MNSTTTMPTRNTRATISGVKAALLSALIVPTLLLSGCFSSPEPACAFSCGENDSCPDNYRCVSDGWCKRNDVAENFSCSTTPLLDASGPVIDGAAIDGSLVDATITDAGLLDAAVTDAAVTDAATDAAVTDAAVTDAAVTDAAVTDAAVTDATVTDATVTDATVTDATVTDATVTDAADMPS